MRQEKKDRDYPLLLLLLLLLCIGAISIYYGLNPYHGNTKIVSKPVPEVKKTRKPIDTIYVDSLIRPVDFKVSDTGGSTVRKQVIDTSHAQKPELAVTEERPAEKKNDLIESKRNTKELIDVSPDGDVACYFDPIKKNLYFYPTKVEWSNVYLIYPSPDKKGVLRRNLIYPDYEGLIYPQYMKGTVSRNGNSKEAVSVRINNKAGRDRSYVIQAKTDPEYFIFGDYDDKTKWYIYEDGKVRKFTPTDNFDAGITEKL